MSYKNAELLRDKNGNPIPQYFDSVANEFKPLTETQDVEVTNNPIEIAVNNQPIDYPDAAVKTELELIKQGIADNKATNDLILDKLNDGVDTQLTGSNIESVSIIADGVYTSDTKGGTVYKPNGAKGVIVELEIGGITGEFSSGEGVSLRVELRSRGRENLIIRSETEKTTVINRVHVFYIHTGETVDGIDAFPGSKVKAIGIPVSEAINATVMVSGTFSEGEGVVANINAYWIL